MKLQRLKALAVVPAVCSSLAALSCSSPRTTGPGAPLAPAAAPIDVAGMIPALVAAHNRARADAGLPELVVSSELEAAAQRHARDMADRRRMSHRGGDGSSPFQRMSAQGYEFRRAGENVAYGQPTVERLMWDWMHSPGHRRNILGKFTEMGASGATDRSGNPYWCVTFGEPVRPDPTSLTATVGYP